MFWDDPCNEIHQCFEMIHCSVIHQRFEIAPYLLLLRLLFHDGLQEDLAFAACWLLVKHSRLDDFLVDVQLVACCCLDAFLDRVDRHQSKHAHLVLLADTMSTVLRLQVLWSNNIQNQERSRSTNAEFISNIQNIIILNSKTIHNDVSCKLPGCDLTKLFQFEYS